MSTDSKPQKPTGRRNVFFFGDSISSGELMSPHRIWVTRLSALIEKEFGDTFLTINTSINGNTTRMALERMPFDVQSYGMDMITIQFGMNDCNFWQTDQGVPRISSDAFQHNLIELVNRSRVFGARVVLLPTSHPTTRTDTWSHVNISYETSRRQYAEIVRDVATMTGAVLVDIEAQVFESGTHPEGLVLSDGIHLSCKGHEFYYEVLAPMICDNLRAIL